MGYFLSCNSYKDSFPEKSNFQGAEKNILCLQTTTISLAISSILQTNYRFENTSNRRNSLISFFTCFLKAFKVGDKLGVSREQKSTTSPVKQTPTSTRRPASDHSSQDHSPNPLHSRHAPSLTRLGEVGESLLDVCAHVFFRQSC